MSTGLAETLRSELLLYSIDIHIMFPGTIHSPGLVEENKSKPKITLKIEESDEGLQPASVAEGLLRGEDRHYCTGFGVNLSWYRCAERAFPHLGRFHWESIPFIDARSDAL